MWPSLLELNVGESADVLTAHGARKVTLLGVEHDWQPDLWCTENPRRETISAARVRVKVAGVPATLVARPYALPQAVNGVRLYVEVTRQWAHEVHYNPMTDIACDVRLSALDAETAWGPQDLRFPIRGYRWRCSAYQNTWGSLVPHNVFYYHRGDDFGAIPDRLDVLSPMAGVVLESPLPGGNGKSNGISIGEGDYAWCLAHMNIETIDPSLTVGCRVEAGRRLGMTGCTWNGSRSQHYDPHLHTDLKRRGSYVSSYPFLVQAYLRDYPDSALAAAGGRAYALPGGSVALDGTRSVARPGRRITAWRWGLHDGRRVDDARAAVSFERPGLYPQVLTVTADDGCEYSDVLQVRVFDPERGRDMVTGFAYYTPLRGIHPGSEVLFWNRLRNTRTPVMIDFGDGSPAQPVGDEIRHAFGRVGFYLVTLSSTGPGDAPVAIKLPLVVDPPQTETWREP